MIKKGFAWILGIILAILPLVSALGYGSWYWSPQDLFNSEWFRFILVFVLFYAIIFFGIQKVFKESKGVSVVISFVVSIIITYALIVRGYLDFYVNSEIMDLIIMFAFLIIIGMVFRFLYVHVSPKISALIIIFIWAGIFFIYNSNSSSLYALPDFILTILQILAQPITGVICAIISLVLLFKKSGSPHLRVSTHP